MCSEVKKFTTKSQIDFYVEEIFDLYANFVGELNVTEIEEDFVRDLARSCANIFSDKDIFDILRILRRRKVMNDDILKNSQVIKMDKRSSNGALEANKEVIREWACNIKARNVRDTGEVMTSTETECITIPLLENKIDIGDISHEIVYKNNGSNIDKTVFKDIKSNVNFEIDNLIILHKKEYSYGTFKEYVKIIVVPKLELSNKSFCKNKRKRSDLN